MQRNLIYYIMPVTGNGVWERNVSALKERAELFNGVRRVVVAVQPTPLIQNHHYPVPERAGGLYTAPWTDVADALGPTFHVTPMPHNPRLRETAAFPLLLTTALAYDGVTFFGHAKGVSWPIGDANVTVHAWTSLLYAANLDYWPLVEKAFSSGYGTVGALRVRQGNATVKRVAVRRNGTLMYDRVLSRSKWHYTGTFFWFDNATVRSVAHDVDPSWLGVELWPGRVFPEGHGSCLFGDLIPGPPYTCAGMLPLMKEFTEWSNLNAEHRRAGASAEPWEAYLCR